VGEPCSLAIGSFGDSVKGAGKSRKKAAMARTHAATFKRMIADLTLAKIMKFASVFKTMK
jgi:hypothetical protein